MSKLKSKCDVIQSRSHFIASSRKASPIRPYTRPYVLASASCNRIHGHCHDRNTFQSSCVRFTEAEAGESLGAWGLVWNIKRWAFVRQRDSVSNKGKTSDTVSCLSMDCEMCPPIWHVWPHPHVQERGKERERKIHSDIWWSWPAWSHNKISCA